MYRKKVGRAGLRKQRTIHLLQHDGNEYAFLLDKRTKLRIGSCYRGYVRQDSGGTDLFPEMMASDLFPGLEDLGEYGHAMASEKDAPILQ